MGTGSPRSARALEPLSEEPKAREAQVESRLLDSAADFLENHVLQFRVPKSTVEGMKRSLEEGQYIFIIVFLYLFTLYYLVHDINRICHLMIFYQNFI